ncbi:MAG: nucleotidyltransferase family protein [Candidatus Micrarchaeia archaeon]
MDEDITGMILAGGFGKRLRPITDHIPKPLVEIKENYCIMDKQLEDFSKAGIKKVILLTGYLHNKIEERYENEWNGIEIKYSVEVEPLGTWGAIRKALIEKHVSESVIIRNGDVVAEIDINDIIRKSNHPVTILGAPMRSPYGILDINGDNKISGFKEKPILPYYINGGLYYVKNVSDIFEVGKELPNPSSIENQIFPLMANEGKLGIYKMPENALWKSIDTQKDLEEIWDFYNKK